MWRHLFRVFCFFKEIVCVNLTSSQWLLEGLPGSDRFLITYGRTLLEVGCPLQPPGLCEYDVTLGADFQVVVTEGVHKAAALAHAPGGFLWQPES